MKPYRGPICANVNELTTLLDAMETQLATARTFAPTFSNPPSRNSQLAIIRQ